MDTKQLGRPKLAFPVYYRRENGDDTYTIERRIDEIGGILKLSPLEVYRRIFDKGLDAWINSDESKGKLSPEAIALWNAEKRIYETKVQELQYRRVFENSNPEEFELFCEEAKIDSDFYRAKFTKFIPDERWSTMTTDWLTELFSNGQPIRVSKVMGLAVEVGLVREETEERDWKNLRVIANRLGLSNQDTRGVWRKGNQAKSETPSSDT